MKRFTDARGRDWTVEINVSAIRRVRDLLDIDLTALDEQDGALIKTLHDDPITLVDVLYVICKPQADRDGITDVQFGEGMAGDAIAHATEALIGEIINFTPSQRDRKRLETVYSMITRMVEKGHDIADAQVAEINLEKIEAEFRRHLAMPSSSATNLPAPSA